MTIQINAATRLVAAKKLDSKTSAQFLKDLGLHPVTKPLLNDPGVMWFTVKDDFTAAKKAIETKLGRKAIKGNQPSSFVWSLDIDHDMKILKLSKMTLQTTKEKLVVVQLEDGSKGTPWVYENVYKVKAAVRLTAKDDNGDRERLDQLVKQIKMFEEDVKEIEDEGDDATTERKHLESLRDEQRRLKEKLGVSHASRR